MLSDIEIALSTKLDTIDVIAKKIGISSDELEPYGKYKG